jgi:hypothetical protein
MDRLVVATGRSRADDALDAGWFAASEAIAGLAGAQPGLVIVYSSVRYDLALLVKAIRQVTGRTPLVGASSSGAFCEGEFLAPGAGVVVLALSAGAYVFGTAAATGLRRDPQGVGRRLAREAIADAEGHPPYGAVLLLADGMAGVAEDLLVGVHAVAGAHVPVIGGSAADDRAFEETFVLHGSDVLEDGAVAVYIGSERPLTVVSGHGWEPTGLPLLVTKVDGPVVHELGGRCAMEVYKEGFRVDDPLLASSDHASTGYHSVHSFGLIQPDGSILVRGTYVRDDQLLTFAPLPAYSAVQVVGANRDELLAVSERVVADAVRDVPDPSVLLMFSCAARMDIFGERAGEEAERLAAAAGVVPTFGFYTYGEFARTTGAAGFHNTTITALAL